MNTRTKCNIVFAPQKTLLTDFIKSNIVTTGVGVYEVTHRDATIIPSYSLEIQNYLKQSEYRYAGKNPNNYLWFNDELWRIIGIVNTMNGPRVKLIRHDSIGSYSWDSSANDINIGSGVNEWSQADLKQLLNDFYYYRKASQTCYNGQNNTTIPCDFSQTGLQESARDLIDTITWNLGTNVFLETSLNRTAFHFYNYERSNGVGNVCSSGEYCTDTIFRNSLCRGKVGLMAASDYGYATSGGTNVTRESCFNSSMFTWDNGTNPDCVNNDWLLFGKGDWLFNPAAIQTMNSEVYYVSNGGNLYYSRAHNPISIRPAVYLKEGMRILNGDGTENNPFILL